MQSISFIMQRIFGTYYYSAFFAVFLIVWVFKTVIYNFLIKVLSRDNKKDTIMPVKMEDFEKKSDFKKPIVTNKSLCESYKI